MVVTIGITLCVLLNLMNPLVLLLLPPLRTLIVTFLRVALMTHVVVPRLTKLFAGWLYQDLDIKGRTAFCKCVALRGRD